MVIEGVLDRPQGTMPVTTDPRTVNHNGASTVAGSVPESDPCPGPRADDDPVETSEWRESVRAVASRSGGARIRYLLDQAEEEAFFRNLYESVKDDLEKYRRAHIASQEAAMHHFVY